MTNSKIIKQTKSISSKDVKKQWLLIDAENVVLGRLASTVSKILRGKHKVNYTPHVDCGDNVIIVNAEKVKLTGKKLTDKKYYWHTGYPGGIKETTPEKLSLKNPEKILKLAVKRMLPSGPLAKKQLTKLKIYKGDQHPHEVQKPIEISLLSENQKNIFRS